MAQKSHTMHTFIHCTSQHGCAMGMRTRSYTPMRLAFFFFASLVVSAVVIVHINLIFSTSLICPTNKLCSLNMRRNVSQLMNYGHKCRKTDYPRTQTNRFIDHAHHTSGIAASWMQINVPGANKPLRNSPWNMFQQTHSTQRQTKGIVTAAFSLPMNIFQIIRTVPNWNFWNILDWRKKK